MECAFGEHVDVDTAGGGYTGAQDVDTAVHVAPDSAMHIDVDSAWQLDLDMAEHAL